MMEGHSKSVANFLIRETLQFALAKHKRKKTARKPLIPKRIEGMAFVATLFKTSLNCS